MKGFAAVALAVCLLGGALMAAEAAGEADGAKAVCPVSGKDIKKEHAVAYKGAEVYFCCPNCPKAFTANTAKFAAKANTQLVATGQAKEVKCPLTGRALNPATEVEVNGVKVAFCCNNCKGKVTKAAAAEQLELVFSDKAFAKGFEVKKAEAK
jgi:YHS domain-containing protein